MEIGISTACLYPKKTEDSFKELISYGYKNFEMFVNAHSEIDLKFLKEMKNIADNSGVKFKSLHPFECLLEAMMFFSNYERRFDESCDNYKRYFEACRYLGADVFVFHGEHRGKHGGFYNDENFYFERYKKLYDIARQFDIYLAQENVQFYRSENVEFIRKMKNALGQSCRFVFDIKQARLSNQNSTLMIEAMGENLIHLHMSDCKANELCLLPGEGECDFNEILQMVKKYGFDGVICTEVYASTIKNSENLIKSKEFMQKTLQM